MVQSPSWAANWFAASQEIPRISRNPKVHYSTHKRPPHVSILGQPNPVHIPKSNLLKIRLILSTHLCLGLPSSLLPSGFPTKTFAIISFHSFHSLPLIFYKIFFKKFASRGLTYDQHKCTAVKKFLHPCGVTWHVLCIIYVALYY